MAMDAEPPVLDLAAFGQDASSPSNLERRHRILEQMRHSCEDFGLFQVINHGVDPELLNKVLENLTEFFQLPIEEKLKCKTDFPPFGYVHQSAVSGRGPLDRKEHFFCAEEDNPSSKLNAWPMSPEHFKKNITDLGIALRKASDFLLDVVSQSLGLEEQVLRSCFKRSQNHFTLLHYPGIPDYEGPILAQHKDGSIFTLVAQLNGVPGYQVCKDDVWYNVTPAPGALIVNIGDLMQVFTNGRYRSALHRVVANKEERFSLAYNHMASDDTEIAPFPQLSANAPPRYRKFIQGDYIQLRFENKRMDSKLSKEITIEHYAIPAA